MEKIFTIPINDAYDIKCGCPLCRLEHDLEQTSLEYVMGAAMMEPDVRIETNRYGFCAKHFDMMMKIQKRLPLALIIESHTQEMLSLLTQEAPGKREFPRITSAMSEMADGCFVCKQLHERLNKYYSNIIYLWLHDETFREKTRSQEYFCPHHLAALLNFAQKDLDKRRYADFYMDHTQETARRLKQISANVSKFCKSFDHRYANEPLGDATHAIEDAITFLNGG